MGELTVAVLGSTVDPRALIPGEPEAIAKNIEVLRVRAEGAEHAAEGLRGVDTGAWTGTASQTFHDKFSYEPGKWYDAADSLAIAHGALSSYLSTLVWAQQQAAQAIHLWAQGQSTTRQAEAEFQQATNQALVDNQPAPIFTDPGEAIRQSAQQTLSTARSQLAEVGETAAQLLRNETANAPEESDWFDDLVDFVGDTGAHALNEIASWGNAIIQHPGEFAQALFGIGLTVVSGVGEGVGLVLDATGGGAVVGVPLTVVSAAGATTGITMTVSAINDLSNHAHGDNRVEVVKSEAAEVQQRSDAAKKIVTDDNGNYVGVKGIQKDVRIVTQEKMNEIKQKLTDSLGEPEVKVIPKKGPVEVWDMGEKGNNITFRSFSETGGDTIDINDVKGIDIGRIHVEVPK